MQERDAGISFQRAFGIDETSGNRNYADFSGFVREINSAEINCRDERT